MEFGQKVSVKSCVALVSVLTSCHGIVLGIGATEICCYCVLGTAFCGGRLGFLNPYFGEPVVCTAETVFGGAQTGSLANRVRACETRAIFVIFIVIRSLRSKRLVFVDRMYIQHFRHVRQYPILSEGAKTPLPKKKPFASFRHAFSTLEKRRATAMGQLDSESLSRPIGEERKKPQKTVGRNPHMNGGRLCREGCPPSSSIPLFL